ncbi:nicotinate-nucleotide adenylyltransferase [Dolichospermum circinale CS-1225]|uniref:Probable nicotinate-nucleotide adenylyltransferase n=1 Tax=Dolichospermum circinale CS-537/01 TaxID=3021739 RepID=A0ABT5A3T1_9CYAN|nr:nicotinate-nucleotide adenylyltransferase [Dolichospermum circinale]MDB9459329.1 nicotinate-nucleotide adenylyltransferase [Dolichospermum circinale CS-545/17]MDB9466808.1 nicotinate-nucleotide adenylyltransferase [Dolichospermum circinale CS-539/09]MDB9472462.1 nicotinate-nucleotide adenylyltransferase [Dolichospermum circinale CS-539]MDB9486587.1 nicotinate-nucleotide adenylyltransferase [Dolichospermum circinale CS-537/01]MDB9521953.1 nicotinate-nucleotide adenylyltransferase [Dolichospe
MKIALFGTSADPPTAGHLVILKWLSEHYDWVAVWAADNPLKSQQTPLSHRAVMLELLIKDINVSRKNIALEQDLSSWRTLETVEKAKLKWGEHIEYTLVIGADLVNQLSRWYHIQDLLQQVQLLIIPRPGYIIDNSSLENVKQMGAKIAIANLIGLDVSSTAFREQGDINTLTPPVVAYIHQQHLYKCQYITKKRFSTP